MDKIISAILDALRCLGVHRGTAVRGTIYVTVPITSGIRQFNLMAKLGCKSSVELREKHRDRWLTEVKKPNVEEAAAYTLMVQILNPDCLVLNPAEIEVDDWSQDDYNDMWNEVLLRFCHTLVVTPDWVFSRGGRLEVQRMLSLGRSVTDVFGTILTERSFERVDQQARLQLTEMGFTEDQISQYLPIIEFPRGVHQPPLLGDTAFDNVMNWIIRERSWQNKVSDFPDLDRTREHGTHNEDGAWKTKLDTYFQRAKSSGLPTDVGGTNLLVFLTLSVAMLEHVTSLYGPLPEPGVQSNVSPTINQLHSPDMTPNQRLAMTMSWLSREHDYVREWFTRDDDDENTKKGLGVDSWWYRQLRKYWHRAHHFGLDSPEGRRQLGKYVSTAFSLAMSRINIWGVPPYPERKSADDLHKRGFFGVDQSDD